MLNINELNSLQESDYATLNSSTNLFDSVFVSATDTELLSSQNSYQNISGSSSYWYEESVFDEYINSNSLNNNSTQSLINNTFGWENSINSSEYINAIRSGNYLTVENLDFNSLSLKDKIVGLNDIWQDETFYKYDEITGERIDDSLSASNYPNNEYEYGNGNNYGSVYDTYAWSTTTSAVNYVSGDLRANTFTYRPGFARTIISGNGNIDFGSGHRDTLDLSNFYSSSVNLNQASVSGGGVAYNPGNGMRIFDAINFSNGSQILFEGIDTIRFADGNMNLSVTPNDPYFNQQWNLHMMGVHNAWRFTTGSKQVMVGVQDTGLGINSSGGIHEDLKFPDYIPNNLNDDYLTSVKSHGTSVQGIIAAKSNNGIGMSGINWNSDVANIDVLDGGSEDNNLAQATQAMINSANQKGQRLVINMSLGNHAGFRDRDFERVVQSNPNVLFMIASGNENDNRISEPAILANEYSNVMAIGASWGSRSKNGSVTIPGQRISYYGGWGSNYGVGLTLMGPSEVIATDAVNTVHGVQFNYAGKFSGTSAATPNVSGVASLVWSLNPYLSATQIREIMSQTAYDVGPRGNDYEHGHGFVNADAAVRRALATSRGYA